LLAADVVLGIIPFVPLVVGPAARAAKLANRADDAIDAMRAANRTHDYANIIDKAWDVTKPIHNGRRGSPAHVNRIREAEERLSAKGWKRVAGGAGKERRLGRRYPDLVMRKGDRTIALQVGRVTQAGQPIARERRAIEDLRRLDAFDNVFYLRY